MTEVKCWTVIALHDSTGKVYTAVQNVAEPHEAIAMTAREIKTRPGWDDVQIVCTVAGDCLTIMPCEDSSKAAYVADLGNEDDSQSGDIHREATTEDKGCSCDVCGMGIPLGEDIVEHPETNGIRHDRCEVTECLT